MTSTEVQTERYVGKCPNCGTGIATQSFNYGSKQSCPSCSTKVNLKRIQGEFNGHVSCDSRCEFAVSPICSCACGGENHSIGYVSWELVPVWVTERDYKRHQEAGARKAARAKLSRDAKAEAVAAGIEALLSENPGLEILLEEDLGERYNYFVSDVAYKFRTYGSLSDAQITAVLKSVEQEDAAKAEAVRRAARIASGELKPAPVGKVTVEGKIVGTWVKTTYFGYTEQHTLQMIVETEAGWKVSTTLPSVISSANKGDVVRLTCTLRENPEDPFFVFTQGRSSKPSIVEKVSA